LRTPGADQLPSSLGLTISALSKSLIGRLSLIPLGGIGDMNHFA